ncbi:MAG: hypothetical protein RLZZ618_3236 [Pseudomonadota bacterium]
MLGRMTSPWDRTGSAGAHVHAAELTRVWPAGTFAAAMRGSLGADDNVSFPRGTPKRKTPCKSVIYKGFQFWWRFRDSNPGPADYDSVALTD